LEWSKAFAKAFMRQFGIPTAAYRTFDKDQSEEAKKYIHDAPLPIVLKADGLAAGKGVVVCTTHEQAIQTLNEMVTRKAFGAAGESVVVEEFLEGEEASVFAVCDGTDFITLAPAQDHKRIFDGDRGKNTGGMGAYAPAPIVSHEILHAVEEDIIAPTLRGMKEKHRLYKGCLYVGLMITSSGPKVIEYNCRFGDPETQTVLPLYNGDIVDLLEAACTTSITQVKSAADKSHTVQSAVCVVLASMGYPDEYPTGIEIEGLDEIKAMKNLIGFHAGTKMQRGKLVTAGGRVLGITAMEATLAGAIEKAYRGVAEIQFQGMQFRRDIGKKAFVH
jgi:phosphoribosylamine--glycine ligase